jgi:NTE family protein
MSAGFFGFYAHAGVVDALHQTGIEPESVSGASAGALVGVLWAAGVEPAKMVEELSDLKREDFWDPRPGFGLLRGKLIDDKLRGMLPVAEFEECGIPANVSVFDLLSRSTEVITEGDLATATRASCAFPILIQPVMIDRRPKLDGGIRDWAGLAGAETDERILYVHLPPRESKIYTIKPPDPMLTYPNLQTLALEGLPQVTPFALHRGISAYATAKAATLEALDSPAPSLNL